MYQLLLISILLTGLSTFIAYIIFKIRYQFWKNLNVPYLAPTFPFGHIHAWFKMKHFAFVSQEMYNSLKHFGHYAGMYFINSPVLFVLTPEFAKQVLVRDFSHFTNRGLYYNKKADPASANLFFLDGDEWRRVRHKFTPTFTSGKIKNMFHTMMLISDRVVQQIDRKIERESNEIDLKDFMACFTTDIIGSCGFGVECNSILDPNSTFREMGRKMFASTKVKNFKNMFCMLYKREAAFLKARFSEDGVSEFLGDFVEKSIKYRSENNICRDDFLQQMIDLYRNDFDSDRLSIDDIVGQLFIFFFGGFETSSATITYCLYELALNMVVQDKLRDELRKCCDGNDGKFTFEAIQTLSYLDKVFCETLRKYPPVATLHRCVSKDYKLPNGSILPKGTFVIIPSYAFHHDPELYPDPSAFDPERFDAVNKANRQPCSYLPFGEGSRNCVGMRFGVMQTKLGIAMLVNNFKFSICRRTQIPLAIDPVALTMAPNQNMYLKVERQ